MVVIVDAKLFATINLQAEKIFLPILSDKTLLQRYTTIDSYLNYKTFKQDVKYVLKKMFL